MEPVSYKYNVSFTPIRLWRDAENQWHYDGPASCGPRHVRTSGRGPAWVGPITPSFAAELRKRLRRAGYEPS